MNTYLNNEALMFGAPSEENLEILLLTIKELSELGREVTRTLLKDAITEMESKSLPTHYNLRSTTFRQNDLYRDLDHLQSRRYTKEKKGAIKLRKKGRKKAEEASIPEEYTKTINQVIAQYASTKSFYNTHD